MNPGKDDFSELYGKIDEMDRSFDVRFWQSQGTDAIFEAAWQLVEDYYQHHKLDLNELRLQRSIEALGKTPS